MSIQICLVVCVHYIFPNIKAFLKSMEPTPQNVNNNTGAARLSVDVNAPLNKDKNRDGQIVPRADNNEHDNLNPAVDAENNANVGGNNEMMRVKNNNNSSSSQIIEKSNNSNKE